MKHTYLNIFCAAFLATFTVTSDAYAIMKLDFFSPISDFLADIEKEKKKIEEKYSSMMEKLNSKIKMAVGAEGAALFQKYMPQNLNDLTSGVVTKAVSGQLGLDDMFEGALPDIANLRLDMETFKNLSTDYINAQAAEKVAKDKKIDEELVQLYAEQKLLDKDDPQRVGYAYKIAMLEQQKSTYVTEEQQKKQEKLREQEAKLQKLSEELRKVEGYMSADAVLGELTKNFDANKKFAKLFGNNKQSDDENAKLYDETLKKLFLAKTEAKNSETVARVMQNRRQEYYESVINLLTVAVEGDKQVLDSTKKIVGMNDDITKQAESNYGGKDLQIGIDIEMARSAALYTRLLLAKIRMDTSRNIQSWSDNYYLKSYSHDVTKFNLDDYIMPKASMFNKLKGQALGKATDAARNFSF